MSVTTLHLIVVVIDVDVALVVVIATVTWENVVGPFKRSHVNFSYMKH